MNKNIKYLVESFFDDDDIDYMPEVNIEDKVLPDYVDLDLPSGTKWATCNIGAYNPEDPGLLFQWGRIDGYKYDDKNHKFFDYTTTSGTKYKHNDTLNPEDDAAYQATNGKLRMPTIEEIIELLWHTDIEWTILKGVNGYKFMSKKDKSKWIFIPAAGYSCGYDGLFYDAGYEGCVWAATANDCVSGKGDSNYLHFNSAYCSHSYGGRYYGYSVRGVLNK